MPLGMKTCTFSLFHNKGTFKTNITVVEYICSGVEKNFLRAELLISSIHDLWRVISIV